MRIDNLTKEQIISLVLTQQCKADYIKFLDYDWLDWIDWGNIHRN